MPPDRSDRHGPESPEQTRAEIGQKIQEAIARNRAVIERMPDVSSDEAFDRLLAEALQKEGQPVTLSVREADGKIVQQFGIYITSSDGGLVRATYFQDDGTLGESFSLETDRIASVVSEHE